MPGRRDRRRNPLLDNLRERRRYWKLKYEVLVRTLWRTRFGRAFGLVVRQTAEWVNAHTCLYWCYFLQEILTFVSEVIRANESWFDSIFHLRSNKQFSVLVMEKIELISEILCF
jgi:hypothetical protein